MTARGGSKGKRTRGGKKHLHANEFRVACGLHRSEIKPQHVVLVLDQDDVPGLPRNGDAMTQGKKFKKQVRARMAQTGESYTTARMEMLKHPLAGDATVEKLCTHQLVPSRVNDKELVCHECGFTKEA